MPIAAALFLLAIASVAYLNADHEEFLFDSIPYIKGAPGLEKPATTWSAFWPGILSAREQVSRFTFALNYELNETLGLDGYELTPYLAVNVLIHAINAFLVFSLIRAIRGVTEPDRPPGVWLPLSIATLFAVHPIHASSVAYIVQRRGMLATLFYLLAVLAFLAARRPRRRRTDSEMSRPNVASAPPTPSPWHRSRGACAAAIPILYWLSYRSKALGLSLPFAILIIEFCLRAPNRDALKRFAAWFAFGLAVSAAGMFYFLWRQGLFDLGRLQILGWDDAAWGPWTHFLTEARAFVHYWKLLWLPLPRWSCIDHQMELSTSLTEHAAVLAVALHGILIILAVAAARRRFILAAIGVFWFYVALIPYAVLPQAELFVEYKTYLPSIGMMLILAELFYRLERSVPIVIRSLAVAGLSATLLLTTVSRNVIYQNPLNLWEDAVAKSPRHARAHNNLADVLLRAARADEALAHAQTAVQLDPLYAIGHFNVANALLRLGRHDEAIASYREAIHLDPVLARAYMNLAGVLAHRSELDEAIGLYREAVRIMPNSAVVRSALADVLVKRGLLDDAIEEFRAAAALAPNVPEMQYNLAMALMMKNSPGVLDEAIAAFRRALADKTDEPIAFFNLGNALVKRGLLNEAVGEYRRAIALSPTFSGAHYNLGLTLANLGQIEEATAEVKATLRLQPDHFGAQQMLPRLEARMSQEEDRAADNDIEPPEQ